MGEKQATEALAAASLQVLKQGDVGLIGVAGEHEASASAPVRRGPLAGTRHLATRSLFVLCGRPAADRKLPAHAAAGRAVREFVASRYDPKNLNNAFVDRSNRPADGIQMARAYPRCAARPTRSGRPCKVLKVSKRAPAATRCARSRGAGVLLAALQGRSHAGGRLGCDGQGRVEQAQPDRDFGPRPLRQRQRAFQRHRTDPRCERGRCGWPPRTTNCWWSVATVSSCVP